MYSYGDILIISLSDLLMFPTIPLNPKYYNAASCGSPGRVINGLQDGYHGSLVVGGGGQAGGDDDGPAGQER